jgi:RNA polymerase sigma factor (sigma-70 family)
VTLIGLLVAVVVTQLLRGELPSKLSNTSIEWSTAAVSSALSAPDRAVDRATLDALDEVKKRIDGIEKESEPQDNTDDISAQDNVPDERGRLLDEALQRARGNEAFAEAVAALPDREKLAYALSVYEKLPISEIARIMEVSTPTASRLTRRAADQIISEVARAWLIRVADLYTGLDAGEADPIHPVLEDARRLAAGDPSRQDPFEIADRIAKALPGDNRAASLRQSWQDELRKIPTAPDVPRRKGLWPLT